MTDPKLREALLPCPFCGSEPEGPFPGDRLDSFYEARCGHPDCAIAMEADTAEQIVERWNRRALTAKVEGGEPVAWLYVDPDGNRFVTLEPPEGFELDSPIPLFARPAPKPASEPVTVSKADAWTGPLPKPSPSVAHPNYDPPSVATEPSPAPTPTKEPITREWCKRMAEMELAAGSDIEAGLPSPAPKADGIGVATDSCASERDEEVQWALKRIDDYLADRSFERKPVEVLRGAIERLSAEKTEAFAALHRMEAVYHRVCERIADAANVSRSYSEDALIRQVERLSADKARVEGERDDFAKVAKRNAVAMTNERRHAERSLAEARALLREARDELNWYLNEPGRSQPGHVCQTVTRIDAALGGKPDG
jgi:hypothetical protein